jgi:hypothetical protein
MHCAHNHAFSSAGSSKCEHVQPEAEAEAEVHRSALAQQKQPCLANPTCRCSTHLPGEPAPGIPPPPETLPALCAPCA